MKAAKRHEAHGGQGGYAEGGHVEHKGPHGHHHAGHHEGSTVHVHHHKKKGGAMEKKRARGGHVDGVVAQKDQGKGHKAAPGVAIAHHGDVEDMKMRGHQKIKTPDRPRVRKRGGHVEGHETKKKLDRRARGGRMSPQDPFSGADVKPMEYYRDRKAPDGAVGIGKDVAGKYGPKTAAHGHAKHVD